MNSDYAVTIKMLKMLDEKGMVELWHDIGIDTATRMFDCLNDYICNYDYDKPVETKGVSDEQDAIDVDDSRRAREQLWS